MAKRVTCDEAECAVDGVDHPHVSLVLSGSDRQSKLLPKDTMPWKSLLDRCTERCLHFLISLGDGAAIWLVNNLNLLTKSEELENAMESGCYPKCDLQISPEISARVDANSTCASITNAFVIVAVWTTG